MAAQSQLQINVECPAFEKVQPETDEEGHPIPALTWIRKKKRQEGRVLMKLEDIKFADTRDNMDDGTPYKGKDDERRFRDIHPRDVCKEYEEIVILMKPPPGEGIYPEEVDELLEECHVDMTSHRFLQHDSEADKRIKDKVIMRQKLRNRHIRSRNRILKRLQNKRRENRKAKGEAEVMSDLEEDFISVPYPSVESGDSSFELDLSELEQQVEAYERKKVEGNVKLDNEVIKVEFEQGKKREGEKNEAEQVRKAEEGDKKCEEQGKKDREDEVKGAKEMGKKDEAEQEQVRKAQEGNKKCEEQGKKDSKREVKGAKEMGKRDEAKEGKKAEDVMVGRKMQRKCNQRRNEKLEEDRKLQEVRSRGRKVEINKQQKKEGARERQSKGVVNEAYDSDDDDAYLPMSEM